MIRSWGRFWVACLFVSGLILSAVFPAAAEDKKADNDLSVSDHPVSQDTADKPEDVKNALDQLSQRVGSLESLGSGFKFGLLFQLRGYIDDTPNAGGLDDNSLHSANVKTPIYGRRSELRFSGNFENKTISYVVMMDPVGVGVQGGLLQDFYITLSPVKYLDFSAGQMKYPQGLEARWSAGDLDFINRAVLSSTFGDKRDYTVQVSGTKFPVTQDISVDYAVAVVNGPGRNVLENNNNKDGAARLGFQYQGLWLGGWAYDGIEQGAVTNTTVSPYIPNQVTFNAASYERFRVGAEMRLVFEKLFNDSDKLKFQAEWAQGQTEPSAGKTVLTEQSGFYLLANYRYQDTRIGVRYELWDPSDLSFSSPGNYQNYLTAGIDQYFAKDKFRWSVNYMKRIIDNHLGGTLGLGDVAETQLQMTF